MNVRSNIAWLLALAAGLGMYGLSLAQEGLAPPTAEQPASGLQPQQAAGLTSSDAAPVVPGAGLGGSAYSIPGNRGPVNAAPSIRQAAEAVRDAEGHEAKADAQKKLTDYLAKYFDEDMVRREKELERIEQRVAKLRELLDRRRNRKQEIIELQAKVALNEAEGLGFYDGEQIVEPFSTGASTYGGDLAPSTADPAAMRSF